MSGLIDGEGTFSTSIIKSQKYKSGWTLKTWFQITLHSKDYSLLLDLQIFFGGVGSVIKKTKPAVTYSVSSIKDLTNIIIPHFDNFPLLSKKAADFILFKQILELMRNKAHLTREGIQEILKIKASMNLGLSDAVKYEFCSITPIIRPLIITTKIQNPNWLAGFVSGEGNFFINIKNSNSHKIGQLVFLSFNITQHERDTNLMELIIKYLGCGNIYKKTKQSKIIDLRVYKFEDITKKIIPFFEKYPIRGIKHLDYLDFLEGAKLMCSGKHLLKEGLEQIRKIKNRMNKSREH